MIMKVVAKPIEMIAWFGEEGKIRPVRFRLVDKDGEKIIIQVDRVVSERVERIAGNPMHVFDCQSEMRGEMRPYQLKFNLENSRWMLFKI